MIYIKYFAKYREWVGMAGEQIDPAPASLAELRKLIREKYPNALKIMEDPRCIVAVNQVVVQGDAKLVDGDEVAFYPPVSGG